MSSMERVDALLQDVKDLNVVMAMQDDLAKAREDLAEENCDLYGICDAKQRYFSFNDMLRKFDKSLPENVSQAFAKEAELYSEVDTLEKKMRELEAKLATGEDEREKLVSQIRSEKSKLQAAEQNQSKERTKNLMILPLVLGGIWGFLSLLEMLRQLISEGFL